MMRGNDSDRVILMRQLFSDTAAQVDAAYLASAGEPVHESLDGWLDAQVSEVLPGAATLKITNEALAARFDLAFAAARTISRKLHVAVPEIEVFAEAGVDLDRLAEAMAQDNTLVPVPAPYGLGAARWISTFGSRIAAHTRDQQTGTPTPKLVIAEEAAREFAALDIVPEQHLPQVKVAAGSGPAVRWTLRLIPAAAAPSVLGLSFAHGPHVTLPEMLMLQHMRVSADEPPLDATTFTWLAGSLAQGRLAARHVYDATECTIRITCRQVVSQGPHQGARPPIG